MTWIEKWMTLGFFLASGPLQAGDGLSAWSFGAQGALVVPNSPDLRITAGSPGLSLGIHGTWNLNQSHLLRPRIDLTRFPMASQTSTVSAPSQTMDTRVSSLALGVDYLYRLYDRWSIGAALQASKWSVDSTHSLTVVPGNPVTHRGTASWWRLGLGAVTTFHISRQLEVEVRALRSHYGQENQVTSTVGGGVLWHF